MKVIDFGDASCRRIQSYRDSYLSGELLVETNHEVQRHLESCPRCREGFREAAHVRQSLRDTARADVAPPELREKIRASLRREVRSQRRFTFWFATAAAALIVVAIGWLLSVRITGHAPHELVAQQFYVASLLEQVGRVVGLGLGDHVHCAVHRKLLGASPSEAQTLNR